MKNYCISENNNTQSSVTCGGCGKIGRPVKRLTIENLLKKDKLLLLQNTQYFFCSTSTCSIVYFSKGTDAFYKRDIKVRVGIKETDEPIPVCYCFDYTKKMILDDLIQNGRSIIKDKITEGIQARKCKCEIANPQGKCCMGDVANIIKDATTGH